MTTSSLAQIAPGVDRAVPVLPSTNLDKTARFLRAIGFDVASSGGEWLHARRGSVEIDFSASGLDWGSPELELVARLCVVRVADVAGWHDRLSIARVRWKMMGTPSLTFISTAAWQGLPAFCLTDPDGNIIWFVQSGREAG